MRQTVPYKTSSRYHRGIIDVNALAEDLGFTKVAANSIDASSDRDFVTQF